MATARIPTLSGSFVLPRLAAWLIVAGVLSGDASAQQQYKLNEQDNWEQTATHDPSTPAGQLAEARRLLAAGQAEEAEEMMDQWIEEHPRHPMAPEAYLIRADALVAKHDEYKALYDYEYIARMFPGSEAFVTALEREFEIAKQYAGGRLRKLWGIRMVGAEDEAEELFIRVQERLPGSQLAEQAGMELADFYFDRRQMGLAVDAYSLFLENYPRSHQINKARRRLIYAHLASFKGPEFDARGLHEAGSKLRDLKADAPAEAERVGTQALLIRIDESDAMKMLQTARWYWRTGNPIAAERTIRKLVHKHQRSVAAAEALRLVPEVLPHLPQRILLEAPDYEVLRAAILGIPPESSAAPPNSTPEASK